jgi:hypothetical protein
MEITPACARAYSEALGPVSLTKTSIGVKVKNGLLPGKEMTSISDDVLAKRAEKEMWTIVFVHSRNETCAIAQFFSDAPVATTRATSSSL